MDKIGIQNRLIPKSIHKTPPLFVPLWSLKNQEKNNNLGGYLKLSEVNLILAQTQSALIATLIHQLSSHVSIFPAMGE